MNAKIISNTRWGERYGVLELDAPEFAGTYRPGQMCMVSVQPVGNNTDPLLRRTFAPFAVEDTIKIIYAVVGRGTQILSEQPVGAVLSLSPPRGTPFKLLSGKKTALIAGGVGIAPIYTLAKALHTNGCEVDIYYGGRSISDIYEPLRFAPAPYTWFLATEDGNLGNKGFATVTFEKNVEKYDQCYTCGPEPMMKVVQQICRRYGKALQVSMEQVMACGIGVCAGCLIDTDSGQKRCCTEGPVFDGHKIIWG